MSALTDQIPILFGPPGGGNSSAMLLAQADQAFDSLLHAAQRVHESRDDAAVDAIVAAIDDHMPDPLRTRVLHHPLVVEGLHEIAATCGPLKAWHLATAPVTMCDALRPCGATSLANVAFALRLRRDHDVHGDATLVTDHFGRLAFPLSDWTITLRQEPANDGAVLAQQAMTSTLDEHRGDWRLRDGAGDTLLMMGHDDCLRLVVRNDRRLNQGHMTFPHRRVRPRLQFAGRLRACPVRYQPVSFVDHAAHAGMTGALVQALLDAIQAASPGIYGDMCALMSEIQGFELPETSLGDVGSFSDPLHPGVMGLNVPYTSDDKPCITPFCFTWLAHELAHTRHYLIDTVIASQGEQIVRNAAEMTGVIPRYGRALSIRTLVQVPYVHLYELTVLMDVLDKGLDVLPWDVTEDPIAFGDDIAAEIAEAVEILPTCADLTPFGAAAFARVQQVCRAATERWGDLKRRL